MKYIIIPIILVSSFIWQSIFVYAESGSQGVTQNCLSSSNWWDSMTSDCGDNSSWLMNYSSQNMWLSNEIASINQSITGAISFDSAPISSQLPLEEVYNVYSAWEIMHRTPMIAGFMWIGEIANFITPAMYIWTPFWDNRSYQWSGNPFSSDISKEPTTYTECIKNQAFLSFWLGERINDSDIWELKEIAKACAQEFYGSYFDSVKYTTREEFLMMMFTLFDESVDLEGKFTKNGKFIPNSRISSVEWYDPYLSLAKTLALLPQENFDSWIVSREITDADIIGLISSYTAYRMDFHGNILDRGMINTEKMKFNIAFPTDSWLVIRIQ